MRKRRGAVFFALRGRALIISGLQQLGSLARHDRLETGKPEALNFFRWEIREANFRRFFGRRGGERQRNFHTKTRMREGRQRGNLSRTRGSSLSHLPSPIFDLPPRLPLPFFNPARPAGRRGWLRSPRRVRRRFSGVRSRSRSRRGRRYRRGAGAGCGPCGRG
jgi:hypothetical protein